MHVWTNVIGPLKATWWASRLIAFTFVGRSASFLEIIRKLGYLFAKFEFLEVRNEENAAYCIVLADGILQNTNLKILGLFSLLYILFVHHQKITKSHSDLNHNSMSFYFISWKLWGTWTLFLLYDMTKHNKL